MNPDLTIHRLARRETDSLELAQVLVARKRQELATRLLLGNREHPPATSGLALERALAAMTRNAARDVPPASPPDSPRDRIDRTA